MKSSTWRGAMSAHSPEDTNLFSGAEVTKLLLSSSARLPELMRSLTGDLSPDAVDSFSTSPSRKWVLPETRFTPLMPFSAARLQMEVERIHHPLLQQLQHAETDSQRKLLLDDLV